MPTIKANNQTYFVSSSKITTPSIKINGVGFIPLFKGNKGTTYDYNRYRYTLGGLVVGAYHAAISRTFINRAPSVSISASSTYIANGSNVTIKATASDPDGDTLTYKWNTGATTSSITVSASNTTNSYSCTVSDPYGATATSNTVSVQWYNPNTAPVIHSFAYDPNPTYEANVKAYATISDAEGGKITVQFQYAKNTPSSGQTVNISYPTYYTWTGTLSAGVSKTITAPRQQVPYAYNGYYIRVVATDSSSASTTTAKKLTISKYTKWKAEYWQEKKDYASSSYGGKGHYYVDCCTMLEYPTGSTGYFMIAVDYDYYSISSSSVIEPVTHLKTNSNNRSGKLYAVKRTSSTVSREGYTQKYTTSHAGTACAYTCTYTSYKTSFDVYVWSIVASTTVTFTDDHKTVEFS